MALQCTHLFALLIFITGKIRDLLEWLCTEIKQRGLKLDWQGEEGVNGINCLLFSILPWY